MSKNNTMRAWIHKSRNLPLEMGMELVENHPRPSESLRPNELLIRVKCVGINPADYIFAEMTWPGTPMIKQTPLPGMDFSGEVISTGSSVTSIRQGDRVFGSVDTHKSLPGTMAELTIAELEGCVRMPPGIDFEQAAGVGTAAITAYETIVLNCKAGDSVFINGGTGGVGTFAIQFAKSVGCHVTVRCSTAKIDLCKQLGADMLTDYRTQDPVSVLSAEGRVFDLIVDDAYREESNLYRAANRFIKRDGRFVMLPGSITGEAMYVIAKNMICPAALGGGCGTNLAGFEQIADWMSVRKVRTVIDTVFEFSDMPRAIEKIKSGSATGKTVIDITARVLLQLHGLVEQFVAAYEMFNGRLD
ncbi:NAD(P)-dependent alcohol dehydrogenase [Aspergillus foveolatus]|uniref:NAD(P)-dependent alcohol dehydrogenase n=1 Tax=Aspergillus foveolatus TaxID=210207 RepID=UPI003CCCA676